MNLKETSPTRCLVAPTLASPLEWNRSHGSDGTVTRAGGTDPALVTVLSYSVDVTHSPAPYSI